MESIENVGGKGFCLVSGNYVPSVIVVGGGKICRIKQDGEVILGDGITPEHAAYEFWKALKQLGATHTQELVKAKARIRELEAQVEDLGCQLREVGNM